MSGPRFTSALYPVSLRAIGLAPEVGAAGTAVAPIYTFPMTTFTPVDKITYLEDTAWRNAMANLYNVVEGVRISDVSIGGPLFPDGIGYLFNNILGDYTAAIATGGGTSQTLSSAANAGTNQISVSGTLSVGQAVQIYNSGSTGPSEVVTVKSGSANPYTLERNLYYNHATGATVIPATTGATFTHTFSLLNSGSGAGGFGAAQPVTHTLTDNTGVTPTVGARQYAYSCLSEMDITGTPTALVEWTGKVTALASSIPAQAPANALTTMPPTAAWTSTVTIGGAQNFNNSEWKLTLTRQLAPFYTNSGQQDPVAIARGYLTAQLALNFDPVEDETEFNYYLQNTQPAVTITASNGLTGVNQATLTINAKQVAFNTAEIQDGKEVFGYNETALLVANTTNVGASGGYSPVQITLTNSTPSY